MIKQQHKSSAHVIYRLIHENDWPAIMDVQCHAYRDVEPESLTVLASKVRLSPDTCWVALLHGTPAGYLLTHPWKGEAPPPLFHELQQLPPDANTLYIHDLALIDSVRGLGCATTLVQKALAAARRKRLRKAALVAVQGTMPFWQKFGFRPVSLTSQTALKTLKKYGEHAQYMKMKL